VSAVRVLHVNSERGWRGGEHQTLLTLLGLRELGVDVALAARRGGELARKALGCGLEVFQIRMRSGFDPLAAWSLARAARGFRAELLHLQTPHAVSLAALAALFGLRARLVAARRVDFRVRSAWKYNRCAAVVAISSAVRGALTAGGVRKDLIRTIPSGVPTEVEEPGDVAGLRRELGCMGGPLIGAVGALEEHKGYAYLLGAMPAVLRAVPEARLVIVGDGALGPALSAQAAGLGIEGSVVFTGFRADAQRLLWAFDVLVAPSIKEGLCTTLMDALVRRIAVVAAETGGIPEVLADGRYGVLVPAADSGALSAAITSVLTDQERRGRLLDGAAQWIRERFSVERMVRDTLELYRELAD